MAESRDIEAMYRECTRLLGGHRPRSPREMFSYLAESTPDDLDADIYGAGALINDFEAHVANLLGKPAAVFMPSGTMCQQIALRIWSDRKGCPNIAIHPQNHLDQAERYAYQRLHGLYPVNVGRLDVPPTAADFKGIEEPVAAAFLELPMRELGGTLPEWSELVEIANVVHERGAAFHMDGARLWETSPYYDRSYAEICALFDSVYVSLYKVLGGISGCMLAGPADFIAEARVWQKRQGGTLYHQYPLVLSAKLGMEHHLPQIASYVRRAREIAVVLSAIPGIDITPDPPRTNMMHVFLNGDLATLEARAADIAERDRVALVRRLQPTIRAHWQRFELSIGDAALELSDAEVDGWFRYLVCAEN